MDEILNLIESVSGGFLPTLARESDEIKIKDNISALKSKRAARKSADFKTKENCAKRAARDIAEFKQKELVTEKVKEKCPIGSIHSRERKDY